MAEDVAEEMLISFIRRVLPWLLDEIFEAVQAAWAWVRRQVGW
jgi:hypothetical protein